VADFKWEVTAYLARVSGKAHRALTLRYGVNSPMARRSRRHQAGSGGSYHLHPYSERRVADPRYGRLSASSGARSAIGASTADYKSGNVAIGTGPFLLASFIVGERAEFARSDGQSDKKPIHQRMHEGVRVWSIKPGS